MVTLGVDAHKATHTVVAVDGNGQQLAHITVAATEAGHMNALAWAARWDVRRWALEDCRHVTRRLEADLLRAGEAVVRVPTRLMAGARRGGRQRGKSDPIDALAVARAALAEPDLPVARLDGAERELRLLVDHREALVRTRTQVQSRLRWNLHELFPGETFGSLASHRWLDRLDELLADRNDIVAVIARDQVDDCRRLTRRINELYREIEAKVAPLAPALLALAGCGALTAAKILGETAGVDRFATRARFARHNGTAPIPVWSGNDKRRRLNRGGNRQLNAALHRIAITQIRYHQPARDYLERRMADGNTKTEAIRALKRRLSDVVYQRLRTDEAATAVNDRPHLAAA